MRHIALAVLLALAACAPSEFGTKPHTPRGIVVIDHGYPVSHEAIDDALVDAEECVGYRSRDLPWVFIRPAPFEVCIDGECTLADGTYSAEGNTVVVGPDLGALRHEFAHLMFYQRMHALTRNARPGEPNCFGVARP